MLATSCSKRSAAGTAAEQMPGQFTWRPETLQRWARDRPLRSCWRCGVGSSWCARRICQPGGGRTVAGPPTSEPFRTVTLPPGRSADTSLLRTVALGSTSSRRRRRSTLHRGRSGIGGCRRAGRWLCGRAPGWAGSAAGRGASLGGKRTGRGARAHVAGRVGSGGRRRRVDHHAARGRSAEGVPALPRRPGGSRRDPVSQGRRAAPNEGVRRVALPGGRPGAAPVITLPEGRDISDLLGDLPQAQIQQVPATFT